MKKTIPAESLSGTTIQLISAMEKANARVQEEGVATKGGNKYLQVSKRMEIFRETFGMDYGIDTTILVNDGKTVVIQAKIYLNDKLLGSGIAEEIRGRGFVNETSAVENCETSAVGRALASLGIHGGEYASINEIEKAEGIRKHQVENKQQPAAQEIKDDPDVSPEENAWHKLSMQWIEEMKSCKHQTQLNAWINNNYEKIEELRIWDEKNKKSLADDIELTFNMRKEQLENGEQ
jgi:hypothetical protein